MDTALRSQGIEVADAGKISVKVSSRSLNRILTTGSKRLRGFGGAEGFN